MKFNSSSLRFLLDSKTIAPERKLFYLKRKLEQFLKMYHLNAFSFDDLMQEFELEERHFEFLRQTINSLAQENKIMFNSRKTHINWR
jgi:hypothetical protein